MEVYASQDSGSTDLGEALYWILRDNGKVLPSTNPDLKETATDVHFTTRDVETKTSGGYSRVISAEMANGAIYRINLFRFSDTKNPSVSLFVTKLAPFVKKK